ncbi:MAG: SemiSWEET transporter [Candidatus Omnitrophica bacterium]|nr:SemiSWEET transporter [Candidatus Omnitrophota bacterium]
MEKEHIGIIGLIAGACTTVAFIPQLTKIIRTRHARDISLYMFLIMTTGILLWLVYGILIRELPIILANAFSLALCAYIILAKLRYDRGK